MHYGTDLTAKSGTSINSFLLEACGQTTEKEWGKRLDKLILKLEKWNKKLDEKAKRKEEKQKRKEQK